jgi:hypothetical protein
MEFVVWNAIVCLVCLTDFIINYVSFQYRQKNIFGSIKIPDQAQVTNTGRFSVLYSHFIYTYLLDSITGKPNYHTITIL